MANLVSFELCNMTFPKQKNKAHKSFGKCVFLNKTERIR